MEENRRLFGGVIPLLVILLCLAVTGFFVKRFFDAASGGTDPAETAVPTVEPTPEMTEPAQTYRMSIAGSQAYAYDDLDFRFLIADIAVSSDRAVSFELSHLKTDEGISLGSVDQYIRRLEEHSYYLEKEGVVFTADSSENEAVFRLFIPYTLNKEDTVRVLCDLEGCEDLVFDVSSPSSDKSVLRYSSGETVSDGKTYEMSVSAAYNITGSYLFESINGKNEEYLLPSTTQVFVYRIQAVALGGEDAVIESASYVCDGSGEILEALPGSIRSEKYENIIGRTISESDTGYLFFFAYDPEFDPVSYTGVLRVKLQGNDIPVEINVDLSRKDG